MENFNAHYHALFNRLFDGIDETLLDEIFKIGTKKTLETGNYLFHQGDKENVLYIVLTGRLRAIKEDPSGTRILGDIGQGEPVGEFALFTKEPRMASVLAIRKSTVLEFTLEEYQTLVSRNPALASSLTNFVIQRLRRNTFQQNKTAAPKNIALVNLQDNLDLNPWTDDLKAYFEELKVPVQVYDYESQTEIHDDEFFDSLEQHEGLNILVCSGEQPIWSHQCLVYADLVILAAPFDAEARIRPIEKELKLYDQSILNKKIYLLLLHEENPALSRGTGRWLMKRPIHMHIHLRKGNKKDSARICRILTNQAVGLVLGGGGAKGYAHIGVMRALKEKGIDIDFLGGTSAGAIYGICMSFFDFEFEQIEETISKSVKSKLTSNDLTIPMVSFLSGKKVIRFIQETFGEFAMEDIWVNSYCVSTNFSKATMKIHDQGLLWKQLAASMAIPGVFPPVVIDHYLHVDGAVMDNLPIEPMYRYPVSKIIAISLSGLPERKVNYQDAPSGWAVLWDKLLAKKHYKIPSVGSIIINSLTLNSLQKQEITKDKVSHYFELNLKGVGFMDDKKWKQIMKKGYDQTNEYLENLAESERFWEKYPKL
jgi:predicted acylesterase/phospholipase RssA/CRP-like cAMP-binding protein